MQPYVQHIGPVSIILQTHCSLVLRNSVYFATLSCNYYFKVAIGSISRLKATEVYIRTEHKQ